MDQLFQTIWTTLVCQCGGETPALLVLTSFPLAVACKFCGRRWWYWLNRNEDKIVMEDQ